MPTHDREPARAPDRRADRGARQGVRRDPRRGLRRPRRPRPPLHHEHDRDAPPAARARAASLLLASRYKPAWLAGTAMLSLAKILENMEIGHNVMHGQWDWMNDPQIHSSTWDWDSASTAEAWKHSHNYVHHTYTNIRGKDRDLGYEIMRIDPHQKWHPVYLLQPFYNLVLAAFFEWGVAFARPRLRGDQEGREVQGADARASSRAWPARPRSRSPRTTSPSRLSARLDRRAAVAAGRRAPARRPSPARARCAAAASPRRERAARRCCSSSSSASLPRAVQAR